MSVKRFASVDVGSFELEMGIYEMGPKTGLRQIDHVKHVIALGSDTYTTGKISYVLVEEMCLVLKNFMDIIKSYEVVGYRAFATSAMREAKNSRIILDQIRVRTGMDVHIISNSEQRFISYKAIALKGDTFDEIIKSGAAIVDISFGSMQISVYEQGSMISTQNLPLGVLRVKEIIGRINTAKNEQIQSLEELVDNELETYKKIYLKDRELKNIIGIGESLLFLFTHCLQTKNQNESAGRYSIDDFMEAYSIVTTKTASQLEDDMGFGSEYAQVLLPCAIIFRRVMEMMKAENVWLPGTLLIDGIAADYAQEKKLIRVKHDFNEDIISEARNVAKRYRVSNRHSQSVERYAMSIFDTMKKYHGMDRRERLLLELATILHNCGKFISMHAPAACAYDIISSTEIIGLSHDERILVARVVRNNLEDFSYNESSMTVAKLTAILRVANGLDRSHKQKGGDFRFEMKDSKLVITTNYSGDMTLEMLSFELHSKFFEEIFGIRPVLKQKIRSVLNQ